MLKAVPLTIAYSFIALTFSAVPLMASLWLDAPLTWRYAIGAVLIMSGMLTINVRIWNHHVRVILSFSLISVRNLYINFGQKWAVSNTSDQIAALIDAGPGQVWVPADFASLDSRDVIDKTLQRMVARGELRRIDRGRYDRPAINSLAGRPSTPDYRAVVDALARRDQTRLLVDGMTAANDLGLTDAVPARVTLYSDTRRRSIMLEKLLIEFKLAAPSRLYWTGRPSVRVVQALHWLKDMLPTDGDKVRMTLARLLHDPKHGRAIRNELVQGFGVLPGWMQAFLRTVPGFASTPAPVLSPAPPKPERRKHGPSGTR